MKSRTSTSALWSCLVTALLLVISGLRDIFARGFFNMRPTVKSNLDVTMEFAAVSIFLLAAASFYNEQASSGWWADRSFLDAT